MYSIFAMKSRITDSYFYCKRALVEVSFVVHGIFINIYKYVSRDNRISYRFGNDWGAGSLTEIVLFF